MGFRLSEELSAAAAPLYCFARYSRSEMSEERRQNFHFLDLMPRQRSGGSRGMEEIYSVRGFKEILMSVKLHFHDSGASLAY
jgi:hypothetical protein